MFETLDAFDKALLNRINLFAQPLVQGLDTRHKIRFEVIEPMVHFRAQIVKPPVDGVEPGVVVEHDHHDARDDDAGLGHQRPEDLLAHATSIAKGVRRHKTQVRY
jgi:hypothetical protein